MFKKVLGLVAAVGAIAAAAIVCIVALAFALYAALRDLIGPAWAAAAVAGAAALIALVLAAIVTRKAHPRPVRGDDQNLTAKLVDLARERPLVAAAAVAAAGAVIVRNPRILTAVVTAALASKGVRAARRA